MKRLATSLFLSIFFLTILHAAPVDSDRARTAAVNWMLARGGGEYASLSVDGVFPFSREGVITHYIINLAPDGFVIVAGDDIAWPVLMYGAVGRYDGSFLPPAVAGMLDQFASDLLKDVRESAVPSGAVSAMWKELGDGGAQGGFFKGRGNAGIASVSPLINATWNQTTPYNQDCPSTPTGGSGGRVYVGCVATAMAMVMHYWGHPATGVGSHSYTHPTYGVQSADYGSTTYNWAAMPNSINTNSPAAAKAAIAQLSYHCGVSVDMDYSPTGSGSNTSDARDALVAYFRYKSTAQYRNRGNYGTTTWTNLLTGELDNGRPVMYRGSLQTGASGHAFIVDGYTGTDYFHMNFGWGGYLDGYFYLNDITPGSNDFTYWQGMITGIEPVANVAPTLDAPAHQSTGICVAPALSWNSVVGATSYRLQVSTSSAFTSTVYDNPSIAGTSATVSGLGRGNVYYWRVNATGSAGTSPWSTTWSFTTRSVSVSAGGPTTFCEGGSVQLNGSTGSGVSYLWSRNGTPISGAAQSSYLATQSGNYTFAIIDNGCPTPSDPITVIVNPLPIAQISAMGGTDICHGQSVLIDAVQSNGASYQWRRNGGDIAGATAASFSATESGSYEVYVEASGCGSISQPLSVTVYPADPDDFVWTGAFDSEWSTAGNWDSPCAVPGTGDNVTIPSGVTPPSVVPALTLGNLTINHAAGLTLAGPLLVSGVLNLQNGNVRLGNYDLIIESTGSIVGSGGTRHIVTNGTGMLRQMNIGTAGRSAAVVFPVAASAGSYTPLTVTNSAAGNSFAVRVSPQVLDNGSSGVPVTAGVVNRTWHISAGTGQTNASLQFAWTSGEELPGFNRALCFVSRNDAGMSWDPLQQPAAAQGSGLVNRMVNGITTIGAFELPYAIGSEGTLFPVEFLSYSATLNNGYAHLLWTTTNEVNNYGFRIEKRAADAAAWSDAGFIPAASAGSDMHSYEWTDNVPLHGIAEFRLAQIDVDGSVHYSGKLSLGAAAASVLQLEAVHPQPLLRGATGSVTLIAGVDAAVRVTLVDALGRALRVIHNGSVTAASSRTIGFQTADLHPGLYFLHLDSPLGSQTLKFIIAD